MTNKKKPNSSKSDRRSTPLANYKLNKKILTPPMASIPNMVLQSWSNERMPEMLWAVLIRKKHSDEIGYAIFRELLRWLADNMGEREVNGVTHTEIAALEIQLRKDFILKIVELAGTDALKPLLLFDKLPAYDDWSDAVKAERDPETDWDFLAESIADVLFHQTQQATDIRWVRLMGSFLGGKMHMPLEMVEKYNHYPNKYDQRSVRPGIRSAEMMLDVAGETKISKWSEEFWKMSKEETQCIPETIYTEDDLRKRYESISEDKKFYDKYLHEFRGELLDHFFKTSKTTSIDSRHETVFGLALYALDVFIENSILEMAGTTSGRVTTRIIFEALVMLKYLLQKESEGEELWDTYRNYGNGQINLIMRKYEDEEYSSSMVDLKKIDSIANEDKWSEYVPINLGNWDASDLRTISTYVEMKPLYDKYYPYTSGFIHANWGAVREASFETCMNPLHRFHRIPLFGLPVMPNVNEDCRQMVNQIGDLLNRAYPKFNPRIPENVKSQESQNKTDL